MYNSKIEWTDATFNPWIGCTKVSPGCKHCYAETLSGRFGVEWGPAGQRKRTSETYWRQPLTWNRQHWMTCTACNWRGKATTKGSHFYCPNCESRQVEPTRQRVFCASLADVFEDRPELIPWRADLFRLIRETPNLDWLLLTKRPENITPMVTGWAKEFPILIPGAESLPNLWLGTSVEDQEQALKRIPLLIKTPAAIRFLSCEPLLGALDIERFFWLKGGSTAGPWYDALGRRRGGGGVGGAMFSRIPAGDIHWVIAGGESGPHARPMHPDWTRRLRDQCAAANVPFFFKQWGEHLPDGQITATGTAPFGGNATYRIGKKAAGRYLDGQIHNAAPPGILRPPPPDL